MVYRPHKVKETTLAIAVRCAGRWEACDIVGVRIRLAAVRKRAARMSGMQGGGVVKNRRPVERLALGDVAHRIERDSILIVISHTMPPAPDPRQSDSG